MKQLHFLLLLQFSISLMAQDFTPKRSHHVRHINSPGKHINGYSIFKPSFQSNNYNVSLMKYIDVNTSDSILGVLFSGYTAILGQQNYITFPYTSLVYYEEVPLIINWLDNIKKEINKDPGVEYLSYSPEKSNVIFFIDKHVNSYTLYIQYDKNIWYANQILCKISYSSKTGYNFDRFDKFYGQLTEIQEVINRKYKF